MKNIVILSMLILGASCSDSFFSKKNADSFYATKSNASNPVGTGEVVGDDGGAGESMEVTENFIQKANAFDIVWMVDNSGSMADEQAALANNFGKFIDNFIQKQADFKMAIITTDVTHDKAGVMVPGSAENLTSAKAKADPNKFKDDFERMAVVGIGGSIDEQGLEAVKKFAEINASFLRPEAYLAVVYISDEEDSSPLTPAEYVSHLKGLKSNPGLAKAYSIVDKRLLNSGTGITKGFKRYADVSAGTGGLVSDITLDFADSLSAMSDDLMNLLDSFALASSPIPGTLKVYVNDVLSTNYTFDVSSRAIKFNAGSLPITGSRIKAVYQK